MKLVHIHIRGYTNGYFEIQAYVYLAELDKKEKEPIEKDHSIIWVNAKEYIGKMATEGLEYILEKYIIEYN